MLDKSFVEGQIRIDFGGIISLESFVENIQDLIRSKYKYSDETTIEDEQLNLGVVDNDLSLYKQTRIVENKCYKFKNDEESECIYINKNFILSYFNYKSQNNNKVFFEYFAYLIKNIKDKEQYIYFNNFSLKQTNKVFVDEKTSISILNNEYEEFILNASETNNSLQLEDLMFTTKKKVVPVEIYNEEIADEKINANVIDIDTEGYYINMDEIERLINSDNISEISDSLEKIDFGINRILKYSLKNEIFNEMQNGEIIELGGVYIG